MQQISRSALAERITAQAAGHIGRFAVAIAGAPGSGKSTLAQALEQQIGTDAQVIPMDGFHRDNDWLNERGLFARKGAPNTFDAAGFTKTVAALKAGSSDRYHTFDRQNDCTLPDAGQVRPDTRILLIEGNYLLLDHPEWRGLTSLWDMTVMLDVPLATLRDRLIQRWLDHEMPLDQAIQRAERNDIPNAQTVVDESRPAQFSVI